MGLVGLGHVGREVARRARALGFTLVGHDPQPPAAAARRRAGFPGHAAGPLGRRLPAREADPGEPAACSPATGSPRCGRARTSSTRPASRWSMSGPCARRWNRASWAGRPWTCWNGTAGGRHPLLSMPNVFVTPHIGGATAETLTRGARRAVAAVAELLAGRVPANVVNPQVLRGRAGADDAGATFSPSTRAPGAAGPCCSPRPARRSRSGSASGLTASRPACPAARTSTCTAGWQAIADCVQDALRAAGATGDDVAAVAATSMREGMVLYDQAGREIWACPNVDSRSAAEAEDLIREGAAGKIYAEAGDWVSITAPARLRWLARHRPGILAATASLGMLSDWIVYRLTGQHVTEPSCGSSSGMFTLADRRLVTVHPGAVRPAGRRPAARGRPGHGGGRGQPGGGRADRAARGHAGGGGRRRHPARPARGRRGTGRVHRGGGTFWQNTVLLADPLIDPEVRLRTLCHVMPGRVDARGHRLLLRHEHAVVPRRVLRRRSGAGPQPGRRTRTGDGGGGGQGPGRAASSRSCPT